METIVSGSVSVPCWQNHRTEIMFPMIVNVLAKFSISVIFYIIEKLNVSEIIKLLKLHAVFSTVTTVERNLYLL